MMHHAPVLLQFVVSLIPEIESGKLLDVTAGGGGHFFAILEKRANWSGECWDQDALAKDRILSRAQELGALSRVKFAHKNFSEAPAPEQKYDMILGDLGLSSFQLDDQSRGMSLFSEAAPDFRMNRNQGPSFWEWFQSQSEQQVCDLLEAYGEEPKAKVLARKMKTWTSDAFRTSASLSSAIASALGYKSPSRIHPATRAFQAFRIAINDEMGSLRSLLEWAPARLNPGGRLVLISFHSGEDRLVKNRLRDLASEHAFVILTAKPLVADENETARNPRARSAKLRALEKNANDRQANNG